MALPTLTKTWNFAVNVGKNTSASAGLPAFQAHWYNIANTLRTFSPGWTVKGSGASGAGGAMDNVWRWNGSNLVNGSWVVFQNDAITPGFQLLIQGPLTGGGGWPDSSRWAISPGGLYTGGAESTKPTATDEIVIAYTTNWQGNDNRADSWLHMMMSNDGQCTRILVCEGNTTRNFYLFDKPVNPVSGWTNPWVAIAVQGNGLSGIPTYTDVNDNDVYAYSKGGSANPMKLYLTSEGYGSGMIGENLTVGNDLAGNALPMAGVGLASATAGASGRHGSLADLWWGSTAVANGSHYPDTLPRQFVQAGHIILPWPTTAGGIVML